MWLSGWCCTAHCWTASSQDWFPWNSLAHASHHLKPDCCAFILPYWRETWQLFFTQAVPPGWLFWWNFSNLGMKWLGSPTPLHRKESDCSVVSNWVRPLLSSAVCGTLYVAIKAYVTAILTARTSFCDREESSCTHIQLCTHCLHVGTGRAWCLHLRLCLHQHEGKSPHILPLVCLSTCFFNNPSQTLISAPKGAAVGC